MEQKTTVPVEGTTPAVSVMKDGSKGGAMAPMPENVEEESAATDKGAPPLVAEEMNVEEETACSSSKVEDACEGLEENNESSPEEADQQEQNPVAIEVCGPDAIKQFIFGIGAGFCIVMAIYHITLAANAGSQAKFMNHGLACSAFFLLFVFSTLATCYYSGRGFNPAVLWGAASTRRERSMRYTDCQVETEDEDIENQRIQSTGSEYAEATDKQQMASPSERPAVPSQNECPKVSSETSRILQPASKSDSPSKVSEIASAISQIATETITKKELMATTGEAASSGSKEENAKGTLEDKLHKDSDQDGSSSGELRRRKFPNTEDCKNLTNSSDEEAKKD